MAQPPRALGNKGFVLFIIAFLILTDLAIILDIPVLRPALGFLFFTIIPGLLILNILKLNQLDPTERLVFSVGLSVAFLMFFGLLINSALFPLGYATPLSTSSLVISFSIILIILAIIGYIHNKDFAFNMSSLKLETRDKIFLLLPSLFPLLSILGMHLMNNTNNNFMLMVMLFLIPAYVILIAILHRRVPQRTYPAMIFLIGISILLLVSLRSSHIIGSDTHEEYYLFQLTANSQHWQIYIRSILDACLSVTLLPAIYQSLMNINPEYLFKILYPLLFSVSPLAIYIIAKKYIGNFYAFLASFFFMSQYGFLWTAPHARNNMAALFTALIIMVLFNDNVSRMAKRPLVIIFAASCIVSHYASTYILFFVLLLTWLGMGILSRLFSKLRWNKGITITFVMLFLIMLFIWYNQIAAPTFSYGVTYVHRTLVNLNQMFISEVRGAEAAEAYGQTLAYSGIPARIKFVFSWLTIIFIAIGVLSTIVRYKRMVSIPGPDTDKPNFLRLKLDTEYWVLSLVCCATLALSVILPYALKGYGMSRTYFQMLTVLSTFFVIGGIMVARLLKSQPYWLLLVILIPYFICNNGTIDHIFGVPGSVVLNSEGPSYNYQYIYDQEGYAARWLRANASSKDKIYVADAGGGVRLTSQGGFPPPYRDTTINSGLFSLFQKDEKIYGYIYLTYNNVVNKEILGGDAAHSLAAYQDKLNERNKIYSNGGSEILYR